MDHQYDRPAEPYRDAGNLADHASFMTDLPDGYVRPKRRPPKTERVTIAKLLVSTGLAALGFTCVAFGQVHWMGWCLVLGFFGAAAGNAKHGAEWILPGFILGALLLPFLAIVIFFVSIVAMFAYVIWTGQELRGLGS